MLKAVYFLLIITSLFLEACTHDNSEKPKFKKNDLSKAAHYNVRLGLAYLKQGDRPKAKKKLLIALKQEPKSADVYSALAYYFEQTKELQEAEDYYLHALALAGNKGAQLNNYGAFLCRKGAYIKAEEYFLKAVRDLSYLNTAGAYENAGLCALVNANQAKAKLYFTSALNHDPMRQVSFYELLQLEIQSGHHANAFTLVKTYSDLVIHDEMLLSIAKRVAEQVGQHTIAQEYERIRNNLNSNKDNGGDYNEYNNHSG